MLPILTRMLTPSDYGTVAMFGIVLSILGAFTGLSVHGAVGIRYFQLEKKVLAEYVGACIGILLISTSLTFLFVMLFRKWLAMISGVPSDWLLIAVVLSGFQFLGNIRLSLWQASGAAKKYGAYQITQSLLNAIVSLILILVVGMAWEGRALSQSIVSILFGIIALWWLFKDSLLRVSKGCRIHSRDALNFGIPLIPHVIGGLLIVTVDRFIIVKLLDVAHAGIYMVALQLGQAIGLVTESFNKAYAPWLMKNLSKPSEVLLISIVRKTYLYFIVVLTAAAVFGTLAPIIIDFWVGKSFRSAGEVVIYICLGFALNGCYYMVTNYIFFESKTKMLALITFVSSLINIPLMFILVKHNGIVGAGQAFMFSQAVSFIGTWWLSQKVYPMPWLKAFKSTIIK